MSAALLVIDVQDALFRPLPRPGRADEIIGRINTVGARARAAGAPVIFIHHEQSPLAYGTPGWQRAEGLEAHAGDHTVRKTTPDSFLRTDLQALLQRLGVTRLVICGYSTDFCVDTTVRRAAGLGFDVTLVADAHTAHDKPHADADLIRTHHNATLSAITSFGVTIRAVPAADVRFAAPIPR